MASQSTETGLQEVGLERSAIRNAKNRASAVQLCVESSATQTEFKFILTLGSTLALPTCLL